MKKEKQKQGVIDKQDLTIIENSEAYELKEKLIEYSKIKQCYKYNSNCKKWSN